jgi:hypothetical protein
MTLSVRINDTEATHLKTLAEASNAENQSEFIRLLIHREWNRRRGRPKPSPGDYQTAHRTGKPAFKGALSMSTPELADAAAAKP